MTPFIPAGAGLLLASPSAKMRQRRTEVARTSEQKAPLCMRGMNTMSDSMLVLVRSECIYAHVGHVWLRTGEEESSGGSRCSESTKIVSTLVLIQESVVVTLNEARSKAGTTDLSKNITRNFAPWEASECSKRNCDSTSK
jgi:hypothetical protein